MDIKDNEFGIHPLDLFLHNRNLNNNLDQTAMSFAKYDGFNIHPIDLFVNNGNPKEEPNNFTSNQTNNGINAQLNNNIRTIEPINKIINISNQYQNPINMGVFETQNQGSLFNNGYNLINPISNNTDNNRNEYKNFNLLNPNPVNSQQSLIPLDNQSTHKLIYSTSLTHNLNNLNENPQNIIVDNPDNRINAPNTKIQNEPNIIIFNGIDQNESNINNQFSSNENIQYINDVPNIIQQKAKIQNSPIIKEQKTIIQNSPLIEIPKNKMQNEQNINMDILQNENAPNIIVQRTIQNNSYINGQSTLIQYEPTILQNIPDSNRQNEIIFQNTIEQKVIIQDIPKITEQKIIINNIPNLEESIVQTIPKINEARANILNKPYKNIIDSQFKNTDIVNMYRTPYYNNPKLNKNYSAPNININKYKNNINLNYIIQANENNNLTSSTALNNRIHYLYKRMENLGNNNYINSTQNNATPLFSFHNNLNRNINNLNQKEPTSNILNKSPDINNIIPYDFSSYEPA